MSAVEVAGLCRTYAGSPPVAALRGVDLVVPSDELVAVLGPSGCGKTTLLRLIAGFDRPDSGTITVGGTRVAGGESWVPPDRRRVGIVPQEGALFPHLDVQGNVAFGLHELGRRERAGRVAELLELVGLSGFERRRPHELSGGQQQRVAVARALAPLPAVVLLDEPFAALDTGLRAALRDDVGAALRAAGTTSILVTHDQAEALTMADTVAVMRDGRIVQASTPEDLYLRPVDLATARFIGDALVLPGTLEGCDAVRCALGVVPIAVAAGGGAGHVDVMLRPEQVVPDPGGVVDAFVRHVRYEGHDALVELMVDGRAVMARWTSIDLPPVGATVKVAVKGKAVVFRSDQVTAESRSQRATSSIAPVSTS
jgi:iron(III) transport system ATP-binding protein